MTKYERDSRERKVAEEYIVHVLVWGFSVDNFFCHDFPCIGPYRSFPLLVRPGSGFASFWLIKCIEPFRISIPIVGY